jgi:ribokinase
MAAAGAVRAAAVGHVEWVQFGRVRRVPRAGEVAHASGAFEEPAGGGAVAAVQLARLAGTSLLITALGRDDAALRSLRRLRELGVRVQAVERDAPTRRAATLTDDRGERTIITFGERLQPLGAEEQLPWDALAEMDAVYFTAGDAAALRAARAARVLVASPRARDALGHGVRLDALVLSEDDEIERRAAEGVAQDADAVLLTRGERGGTFHTRAGERGSWVAAPPPVQVPHAAAAHDADSYGCGDSFAAGVAFGLGSGMPLREAIALGARCGAACATGAGPYERQLRAPLQPR